MSYRMSVSQDIAAPIEQVFDRAADFANAANTIEAITKMEMLTEGPVGVGTRFRETRVMFGREATEEMEIVEFNRPQGYRLFAESHGSRYDSGLSFEQIEGGTRVTMHFEGTPVTFMAKIMSFMMKPMMKKMVSICAKDLEDLKAAVEK